MIKPNHLTLIGLSERFISKERQNDSFEMILE